MPSTGSSTGRPRAAPPLTGAPPAALTPAPAGAEGWLWRHRLALLGLVLAVAAWLRLAPLGEAPLWQDEAYSLWFSEQSWDFLWRVVPLFENHPPLYYGLLKAWREVAGSSEAALRFPSAVAGIGLVAVMALAGRIAGGGRSG
jgi:predicted membrane-bound mannosyltransferase